MVVAGSLVGFGLLALALAGKWDAMVHAMGEAPLLILAASAGLQVTSLVFRSEAWHRCVRAAGGTVPRRQLYRVASVGYLGNIVNGELGFAVRVAGLRRTAPRQSPKAGALAVSETPLVLVEASLAAIVSFTLVAPLDLPFWVPIALFAFIALVAVGMRHLAQRRGRKGSWFSGLSVLRDPAEGARMAGFLTVSMIAQVMRNFLLLHAVGIDASLFDSMAVLIAVAAIGALPSGPMAGTGAFVLILGAQGVAGVAGAGLLLTATGALGAFTYAAWALADHFRTRRRDPAVAPPPRVLPVAAPA